MIPIMRCEGHTVYCYKQGRLPVHIKNPLIDRRGGQLGCDVLIFTREGIIARGRQSARDGEMALPSTHKGRERNSIIRNQVRG
jgi:hypothetical protein